MPYPMCETNGFNKTADPKLKDPKWSQDRLTKLWWTWNSRLM